MSSAYRCFNCHTVVPAGQSHTTDDCLAMIEPVCVCMELPGKAHWFVWSMKRRNVELFVDRMSLRHDMRLRAIVRIKRA